MTIKICDGKGCGAEIRMIEMRTGGWMPVEAESQRRVVINTLGLGEIRDTHEPHWGNCPAAKKFRRKK